MAIRARNDFLVVMNHETRTIELSLEQRAMVETILKSSHLLETLINDVLELSRLEDGSLELNNEISNLHGVCREVRSLVRPVSTVKKIALTLILSPDLPFFVVGDEK